MKFNSSNFETIYPYNYADQPNILMNKGMNELFIVLV